ncbi:MAG TPA: response regulator transcription factor [Vicinamibacteria bacterium]|nr:response regulator transcription factor [Vicinamibacteria bacterium]
MRCAMAIRVLLADDNVYFREGLASLLAQCADVAVVGLARDARDAVRKAAVLRPDVVLMDLAMPEGSGVAATRDILAERPEVAVCVLAVSERDVDLFAAVHAGARGYLSKCVSPDELHAALTQLADGGSVVTPRLAARLLAEFAVHFVDYGEAPAEVAALSPRERQVLALVTRGLTNRAIADALVVAPNTVKVHLRNILDKLHLRNRQQAAAFATQQGLGDPRATDAIQDRPVHAAR